MRGFLSGCGCLFDLTATAVLFAFAYVFGMLWIFPLIVAVSIAIVVGVVVWERLGCE